MTCEYVTPLWIVKWSVHYGTVGEVSMSTCEESPTVAVMLFLDFDSDRPGLGAENPTELGRIAADPMAWRTELSRVLSEASHKMQAAARAREQV